MSNKQESPGHSERPAAPAAKQDAASDDRLLQTPVPASALPATTDAEDGATDLTPHIDAHGFDAADYKWVPVRRRPRKDGWSEAKQRMFIEHLADSACVQTAAAAVQMSVQSAYALRRAPGGESFAAAWEAAIQQGALKLADVAFQRALNGTEEPVFDRGGSVIGHKTRYSERLMMFLLRAHLPQRYAHASRALRGEGAPDTPASMPVAEALARLEPAEPEELRALMPPEELDIELQVADIMDGELPHYYKPVPPEQPQFPLGVEFECGLEAAKHGYLCGPDGKLTKDVTEQDSGATSLTEPPAKQSPKRRAKARSGPKLP
ncbi:MAG: hypothetical protein ABJM58_07795 [Alteripontixanthobacter sp.]